MKRWNLFLFSIVITTALLSSCSLQDKLTQALLPRSLDGTVFEIGDHTITLFIQNLQSKSNDLPIYITFDSSGIPDYEAPTLYSNLRVTIAPQAEANSINAALSPEKAANTPGDAQKNPIPIKKATPLGAIDQEAMAQITDAQLTNRLQAMTLEEKVGQLFFARYPGPGADQVQAQYQFGGYLLFGRDFKDKNAEQIKAEIQSLQQNTKIPMLIGVDEEGGEVVRVSTNPLLRATPFGSPQALLTGGLEAVKKDTLEKDALLKSLGINVNFAPVCDLSENPADYIYCRTTGKNAQDTSDYVNTVVDTMKKDNMGSVLKHFPGYGPNLDTHKDFSRDTRSLEVFKNNDFLPFKAGIAAGADTVLVSHNVIEAMDKEAPASLSAPVHSILRKDLSFDGVILTDDLDMDAITKAYGAEASAVAAIQAGNDMIISSRYDLEIPAVTQAVKAGTISQEQIDAAVKRVLRWKVDLGVL